MNSIQLIEAYAHGIRDFSNMDLHGLYLSYEDLSGCDFSKSDLVNARLNYSILNDCDFSLAEMKHANLCAAKIAKAKFTFFSEKWD